MLVYRGLSLLSRTILPTFIARPQAISLPAFVKARAIQTTPRVAARASPAQVKTEKSKSPSTLPVHFLTACSDFAAPTKTVKKAAKPAKKVAKKVTKKVTKPAKKAKKPKEAQVSWRGVKVPVKPKSPYISFYVDYLRGKNVVSTAEAQTLAKDAAVQWKSLSESDKDRYRKIFETEQQRFRKEKEEWLKSVDPAVLKAVNRRRQRLGKTKLRTRSKLGPRPSGPFVRFIQDQRHTEVAGKTWKEKLVSLSAVWRELPATEKEHYKQLALNEFADRQAASPQL